MPPMGGSRTGLYVEGIVDRGIVVGVRVVGDIVGLLYCWIVSYCQCLC